MSSKTVEVPRELLERYVSDVEAHNYGFDGGDEIRDILDAPVVERQPVAWLRKVTDEGGNKYSVELLHNKPSIFHPYQWDSRPATGFKIIDSALYAEPPELAELQATIAHLRNDLEGTRLLAADQLLKIKQQVAEIERLKGEPASAAKPVLKCSFCDMTDDEGNPWSTFFSTKHGKLICQIAGCKDHKHLVDACIDKIKELNQ
jgi:hypothetical protein